MVGKDNWRGFLDAIYSKWRLFLPILSPFSPLPQLLPATPPPFSLLPSRSSSPGEELPIFPLFPFFSASILYSNVKYGLTSSVWLRGRLSLWIANFGQRCNLFEMANQAKQFTGNEEVLWTFLLWKKFVFSHCIGEHLQKIREKKNLIEASMLCFNGKSLYFCE